MPIDARAVRMAFSARRGSEVWLHGRSAAVSPRSRRSTGWRLRSEVTRRSGFAYRTMLKVSNYAAVSLRPEDDMLLLRFFTAYSADTSLNLPKHILDLGLGTSSALLHTLHTCMCTHTPHNHETYHASGSRSCATNDSCRLGPGGRCQLRALVAASRCPLSPKVRGGQAQPFAHAMGKRKRDGGDLPLDVQDQVRMGPPPTGESGTKRSTSTVVPWPRLRSYGVTNGRSTRRRVLESVGTLYVAGFSALEDPLCLQRCVTMEGRRQG